jgi:nitroimidazol reductase NimA-like FMN-containing flavoprotein (pyridoxamine 5'-phosphate oxidase superfamily)
VAVLATVGAGGPVAIPVSAIWRRDAGCVLLALARRRASVDRLRDDPRVALSLNGPGFSVCVEGDARVAADPLPGADAMVAFAVDVRHAWDARGPATEVDAGIRWRWTADDAADRHAGVLAALEALARV